MTDKAKELHAQFVTMPITKQFEVGVEMGFVSEGEAKRMDMIQVQNSVYDFLKEAGDEDLKRLEGEMLK